MSTLTTTSGTTITTNEWPDLAVDAPRAIGEDELDDYLDDWTPGQKVRREVKLRMMLQRIQLFEERIRDINAELASGEIGLPEWETRMGQEVKRTHVAAYITGRSGKWGDLERQDVQAIEDEVDRQLGYLRQWRNEIAAQGGAEGEVSEDQLNIRGRLYGAASSASFERGYQAERGLPPGILPAQPGDGTTECLCITTPTSRVLTQRGWVPLFRVRVGDRVWTHKQRWKPVTAVNVKPSKPTHKEAYVRSPTGRLVGATGNHLWHTTDGWRSANSIDNRSCNPYFSRVQPFKLPAHANHDKHLHELREAIGQSGEDKPMHGMPKGVPEMWGGKRSPVGLMQVLRELEKGQEAMGRATRENDGRHHQGPGEAPPTIRGYFGGLQLANAPGRTPLHLLLGGGQEALDIPLSMEMATGVRGDTGGVRDPSPGRRPVERRPGQSRVRPDRGTQTDARHRNGLRTAAKARGKRLRDVRQGVHAKAAREPTGEVLLSGMLPRSTAVFDLTVADDHSFCVEGLFAHNTNCHCRWSIRVINKERGDFDCNWMLGAAEHCETCRDRAREWIGLRIRDGELIDDPEPIFFDRS